MARQVRTNAARVATALVWLGLSSGCTSDGAVDNTERDAAIYQSVIVDVIDQSGPDLDEGEEAPVVFVEAFDADSIPLEVQVEVVGALDDYEIRFIDDREEAIDLELAGAPVRNGTLLIGLGPIVLDRAATVRGELYLNADEVRAHRYTLTVSGSDDTWRVVVRSTEEVEPEGFVAVS